MKRLLAIILFLTTMFMVAAQDSTNKNKLRFSGFADLYYQYDCNQPVSNERPPFIYNHKKHNKPSVNLALLKVTYEHAKLKANLAVMAGDYARYNLAAEPRLLQYVYEANAGYRFTDKLSAEAGILPSHIGIESAISKDCWNLSRSLLAESSPYYETGVRLNYAFNQKWTASALLLQGWQNIKDNNRSKALGTQLVFKPNESWVFNSSAFIGNEQPDSLAAVVRMFHNLSITYTIDSKANLALLLDAGVQGKESWWGSAAMLQYKFNKQLNAAMRAEYYSDKNGIIVSAYKPIPFSATGLSVNVDYLPLSFISFRTELKYIEAPYSFFTRNGIAVSNGLTILASVAVGF
ncbi:porin [Lacibacter luteus]|uniref:Porin n=1 Tax=Lacibacter luteus TaxID=2508719 RepID=A0A4Q1CG42_9BACT|nr:porin [Lacibacter luteus]RXK58979.1 porin [Lacibacter luteus]